MLLAGASAALAPARGGEQLVPSDANAYPTSGCDRSQVVFNHIPKVAGDSFISDLKWANYNLTVGFEPC